MRKLSITMSALFPTSMEPIASSHSRARAPSMVAMRRTWLADSTVGSPDTPLWRSAATFMVSNMSAELLEHGPSVPSATVTPASRSLGTGLIPDASLRFETGLCTTFTPRDAKALMSPSVRWTQCAATTSLPRTPKPSRYSTTPPSNLTPNASSTFLASSAVSARCICNVIGASPS